MKNLTLTLAACIVALIFSSYASAAGKKGHKLFNFELTDINKKDVEIRDYTNKAPLTVVVFFAEYCTPCIRELDSINKVYTQWEGRNVNFIAVCVSNEKNIPAIQAKAQSHGWKFNMLVDDRNEAVNMLRISTIPFTLVVDKDGYIVYTHAGYSADNLQNINDIVNGNGEGKIAIK